MVFRDRQRKIAGTRPQKVHLGGAFGAQAGGELGRGNEAKFILRLITKKILRNKSKLISIYNGEALMNRS